MRFLLLAVFTLILSSGTAFAQGTGVSINGVDLTQFPIVTLKLELRRPANNTAAVSSANAQLTENGIPQTVDYLECPTDSSIRLSIAVLLDRSGSMARDERNRYDPDSTKIKEAKRAISIFLDLIDSRDEAAIFSFTTGLFDPTHIFTIEHDFSSDVPSLKGALVPIRAEGGTRLWDAILDAVQLLQARPGRKVLIVVTDGRDRSVSNTRDLAIRTAVEQGIPVYPIGLGGDVDVGALSSLASATGGKFYESPAANELENIFTQLGAEVLTDDCVLRYTSSNPCLDGSRRDFDLSLVGLGFAAEADTFYTVDLMLNPVTVSVETGLTVEARDTLRVPVNVLEQFPTSQPLSYSMTVLYDVSLMRFLQVDVQGSMSAGRLIDAQEATPGVLTIRLDNMLPLFPTGTLFSLFFQTLAGSSDVSTQLEIRDGKFTSLCPMDVSMKAGEVSISACEQQFSFTSGTFVVSDGDQLDIPIKLRPALLPGESYDMQLFLPTVAAGLVFIDVISKGSMSEAADVLVQPSGQGTRIVIQISGEADQDSTLLFLRFRSKSTQDVQSIQLSMLLEQMESGCRVTGDLQSPVVLVDGICRPLLRRRAATLDVTNHPNPFVDETALTYTLPKDADVSLFLMDAQGRAIRTLLSAQLGAGSYEQRIRTEGLAPGEYLVVLKAGEEQVVRRILCIR
jgi:Mg-chelatase subunit ChlD